MVAVPRLILQHSLCTIRTASAFVADAVMVHSARHPPLWMTVVRWTDLASLTGDSPIGWAGLGWTETAGSRWVLAERSVRTAVQREQASTDQTVRATRLGDGCGDRRRRADWQSPVTPHDTACASASGARNTLGTTPRLDFPHGVSPGPAGVGSSCEQLQCRHGSRQPSERAARAEKASVSSGQTVCTNLRRVSPSELCLHSTRRDRELTALRRQARRDEMVDGTERYAPK